MAEQNIEVTGWTIPKLAAYVAGHHQDLAVSRQHLWRLYKGEKPWVSKDLRRLCERITGAKVPVDSTNHAYGARHATKAQ